MLVPTAQRTKPATARMVATPPSHYVNARGGSISSYACGLGPRPAALMSQTVDARHLEDQIDQVWTPCTTQGDATWRAT